MRLIDIYRARYDGQPERALKSVDAKLLELQTHQSPQWKETWLALMHIKGDCFLDLGNFAAAEECFNEIFNKFRDPVGLLNRGFARWSQGRIQHAKEDYLEAVSLAGATDEHKGIAFRQLARICLDMDEPDEAESFLQCARNIEQQPK